MSKPASTSEFASPGVPELEARAGASWTWAVVSTTSAVPRPIGNLRSAATATAFVTGFSGRSSSAAVVEEALVASVAPINSPVSASDFTSSLLIIYTGGAVA